MYKETRIVTHEGYIAESTPQEWSQHFACYRASRLSAYRKMVLRMDERYRLIRKYMSPKASILDAGCGLGDWVCFLAHKGYLASGLDYSENIIAKLKKAYPDYEWVHGDIHQLPYDNGSFDGVISWGVIEHREQGPENALKEFYRVLKPGGVAIVTVPNDTRWSRRASRTSHVTNPDAGERLEQAIFFQYLMKPDELSKYCQDVGFDVLEAKPTGGASLALLAPNVYTRLRHTKLFRPFNAAIKVGLSWWRPLHNMVYAVAKKPTS